MALPKKITYPVHTMILPSTKEEIKIRPFTGKEEKLFLLAKAESDNPHVIQDVVLQVISNCLVEVPPKFDINKIKLFDIEYLFLQLHSKSIDSQIDFIYNNKENIKSGACKEDCPTEIKCKVNLNDITVKFDSKDHKEDGKIILYDSEEGMLGIKLSYPSANILKSLKDIVKLDEASQQEFLVYECLEYFFDKDAVYTPDRKNQSEVTETKEMISNFTFEQNKRIREFFENIPAVEHNLDIICPSCGHKETITLKGLQDFFL